MTDARDTPEAALAALAAGTHEPAVDDFGNQYLARVPRMRTVRRVGQIVVQEPIPDVPEDWWDRHAVDDQHPCFICGHVTSHDHSTAEWNAALALLPKEDQS